MPSDIQRFTGVVKKMKSRHRIWTFCIHSRFFSLTDATIAEAIFAAPGFRSPMLKPKMGTALFIIAGSAKTANGSNSMGNILVKPLAGKSAKTAKSIAAARPVDALFTKSRQRVLTVLFGHPERSFYANEIITLAQVGTGATQRELAALADAGLLTVSKQGKQKHYQANPGSELAAEIYAIVRKTMFQRSWSPSPLAPKTCCVTPPMEKLTC
jgi:hypothetical protein